MMRLRSVVVLAGSVLAPALIPALASASTYCVSPATGCDAVSPSVGAAFASAAASAGPDTIRLGAGTYAQPGLRYAGADELTVEGAGRTSSTLTGLSPTGVVLDAGDGSVTLRHLRVEVPAGNGPLGVASGRLLELDDIEVVAVGGSTGPPSGVRAAAVDVRDSSIATSSKGECVSATSGSITGLETLDCLTAVGAGAGGALTVRSSRLDGGVGAASGSDVLVEDSIVDGVQASGGDATARLVVRQSTITGDARATVDASLSLRDSIVLGAISREGDAGPADVTLAHVDAPSLREDVPEQSGPGELTLSDVTDADPRFADADMRLQPWPPLINADPAPLEADEQPTDLDGGPRIVGGARDLGAYESPVLPGTTDDPAPPPVLPASPAPPAPPAAAPTPRPPRSRSARPPGPAAPSGQS